MLRSESTRNPQIRKHTLFISPPALIPHTIYFYCDRIGPYAATNYGNKKVVIFKNPTLSFVLSLNLDTFQVLLAKVGLDGDCPSFRHFSSPPRQKMFKGDWQSLGVCTHSQVHSGASYNHSGRLERSEKCAQLGDGCDNGNSEHFVVP